MPTQPLLINFGRDMAQIRDTLFGKKGFFLMSYRLESLLGYCCQPSVFDISGSSVIKPTTVMWSCLFSHSGMTDR